MKELMLILVPGVIALWLLLRCRNKEREIDGKVSEIKHLRERIVELTSQVSKKSREELEFLRDIIVDIPDGIIDGLYELVNKDTENGKVSFWAHEVFKYLHDNMKDNPEAFAADRELKIDFSNTLHPRVISSRRKT